MTTTPGALSEREAIARVIDPHEWQLDDLAKKKGFRTVFTDESLAKADAILALRPPAPQGLRPEVLAFAYLMEDQLRANDHKPGWTDDLPCDLIPRLREEAIELEEATNRHAKRVAWGDGWMREDTRPRVAHEAADVANFAMMIADVCGALPSRLASLDALRPGEDALKVPLLDPVHAEEHPLLAPIIAKRARAAANFSPEFSGQRGADFDRGLLCAFEAVIGQLQRMTAALKEASNV